MYSIPSTMAEMIPTLRDAGFFTKCDLDESGLATQALRLITQFSEKDIPKECVAIEYSFADIAFNKTILLNSGDVPPTDVDFVGELRKFADWLDDVEPQAEEESFPFDMLVSRFIVTAAEDCYHGNTTSVVMLVLLLRFLYPDAQRLSVVISEAPQSKPGQMILKLVGIGILDKRPAMIDAPVTEPPSSEDA